RAMAAGEQQSRDYLERHGLPALFHRLAALLLYHRPERPRQFLIQTLEAVRAARRGGAAMPAVLDEADVETMFRMMDAAGRGFVTALETLGLMRWEGSCNPGSIRQSCRPQQHRIAVVA
uniref:EF-hand calcium binding domain 10 n=1 Tax=Coturnix japonica TaxID=93934 RepID=A0A8C2T4L9_COTJA